MPIEYDLPRTDNQGAQRRNELIACRRSAGAARTRLRFGARHFYLRKCSAIRTELIGASPCILALHADRALEKPAHLPNVFRSDVSVRR